MNYFKHRSYITSSIEEYVRHLDRQYKTLAYLQKSGMGPENQEKGSLVETQKRNGTGNPMETMHTGLEEILFGADVDAGNLDKMIKDKKTDFNYNLKTPEEIMETQRIIHSEMMKSFGKDSRNIAFFLKEMTPMTAIKLPAAELKEVLDELNWIGKRREVPVASVPENLLADDDEELQKRHKKLERELLAKFEQSNRKIMKVALEIGRKQGFKPGKANKYVQTGTKEQNEIHELKLKIAELERGERRYAQIVMSKSTENKSMEEEVEKLKRENKEIESKLKKAKEKNTNLEWKLKEKGVDDDFKAKASGEMRGELETLRAQVKEMKNMIKDTQYKEKFQEMRNKESKTQEKNIKSELRKLSEEDEKTKKRNSVVSTQKKPSSNAAPFFRRSPLKSRTSIFQDEASSPKMNQEASATPSMSGSPAPLGNLEKIEEESEPNWVSNSKGKAFSQAEETPSEEKTRRSNFEEFSLKVAAKHDSSFETAKRVMEIIECIAKPENIDYIEVFSLMIVRKVLAKKPNAPFVSFPLSSKLKLVNSDSTNPSQNHQCSQTEETMNDSFTKISKNLWTETNSMTKGGTPLETLEELKNQGSKDLIGTLTSFEASQAPLNLTKSSSTHKIRTVKNNSRAGKNPRKPELNEKTMSNFTSLRKEVMNTGSFFHSQFTSEMKNNETASLLRPASNRTRSTSFVQANTEPSLFPRNKMPAEFRPGKEVSGNKEPKWQREKQLKMKEVFSSLNEASKLGQKDKRQENTNAFGFLEGNLRKGTKEEMADFIKEKKAHLKRIYSRIQEEKNNRNKKSALSFQAEEKEELPSSFKEVQRESETFEKFEGKMNELIESHSVLCGIECPHLRRFYERYWVGNDTTKEPIVIMKTVFDSINPEDLTRGKVES